jgi:hypothetical protein
MSLARTPIRAYARREQDRPQRSPSPQGWNLRQLSVLVFVLVAALALTMPGAQHLGATPRASGISIAPRDSMCDPQHGDVSNWKTESTPALLFSHPPDYASDRIDSSWHAAGFTYNGNAYRRHSILIGWSGKYDTLDLRLQYVSRFSTCIAYGIGALPSAVVARWTSYEGRPPVYLGIFAQERVTLAQMRQIFWTVSFAGMNPDTSMALRCATPIRPHGQLTDLLDTALVGVLGQNLLASTPRGYMIMELSFDSSGAVDGVELLAGDLPVASQKNLATVVASNAKTQPPASPHAAVRVEVADSGFKYQLIPVSACPAKK